MTTFLSQALRRYAAGESTPSLFFDVFIASELVEGDILWIVYRLGPGGEPKVTVRRKTNDGLLPEVNITNAVIDWDYTFMTNIVCQWPWRAVVAKSFTRSHSEHVPIATYCVSRAVFASPARKVGDEYVYEENFGNVIFPIYESDEAFGTVFLKQKENLSVQVIPADVENAPLFRGGVSYHVVRDNFLKSCGGEANALANPTRTETIRLVGPGRIGKCILVSSQATVDDMNPLVLYGRKKEKGGTQSESGGGGLFKKFHQSISKIGIGNQPLSPTNAAAAPTKMMKVCVLHVSRQLEQIIEVLKREAFSKSQPVPWLFVPTREMWRSSDLFDLELRRLERLCEEATRPEHQTMWKERSARRLPYLQEWLRIKGVGDASQVSIRVLPDFAKAHKMDALEVLNAVLFDPHKASELRKDVRIAGTLIQLVFTAPP
eukprot:PhF_6_TR20007/c0_g1_i1/m.29209